MVVCKRFKQFMPGALNESEQSHKRHQSSIRIYQLRWLEYFSHWVGTLLPAVGIGPREEKKRSTFFGTGGNRTASHFSSKVPITRAKHLHCQNATSDPPERSPGWSLCVFLTGSRTEWVRLCGLWAQSPCLSTWLCTQICTHVWNVHTCFHILICKMG